MKLTKIQTKTTDSSYSTGVVAQNDFKKCGYIDVTFYLNGERIGIEVAGFSSPYFYTFNAKSLKEIKRNKFFVERYIDKCENAISLKSQLGIK
jgi:hypothetical protein